MFMGPLEQVKPWQTSGIEGVRRFLDRVWSVATRPHSTDPAAYDGSTRRLTHKTIEKVTIDFQSLHFNTAISALMIFVKHLTGLDRPPRDAVRTLVLLLSPLAPHMSEELWERLGETDVTPLARAPWPVFDPALVRDSTVEIGVQVNGKLRGTITIAVDADEPMALAAALADDRVRAHVGSKAPKKVIYVKGKIVNFIV
jgi:leucyl-tRNA synthetase